MTNTFNINTDSLKRIKGSLDDAKRYYYNKSLTFNKNSFGVYNNIALENYLNKIKKNYITISKNIEKISNYLEDFYEDVEGIENKFCDKGGIVKEAYINDLTNRNKNNIKNLHLNDMMLFKINSFNSIFKQNINSNINKFGNTINEKLEEMMVSNSLGGYFDSRGEYVEFFPYINKCENTTNTKSEKVKELEKSLGLNYDRESDKRIIDSLITLGETKGVNENATRLIQNINSIKNKDEKFHITTTNDTSYFQGGESVVKINEKKLLGENTVNSSLAHELGHAFLCYATGNKKLSYTVPKNKKINKMIKEAQENLENNPELLCKTLKEIDDECLQNVRDAVDWYYNEKKYEEEKRINNNIDLLYEDNALEKIKIVLNKAGIDNKKIDVLLSDKDEVKKIVIESNKDNLIDERKDYLNLNSEACTLSGMINSITQSSENIMYNGEELFYPTVHDDEYWKEADTLAYEELFANFYNLSVNGQTEALEKIKPILGDELYDELDNKIDEVANILLEDNS